ncbi:hypothetical protein [Micromonospora sp. NPDC050495]|uniref:hypothetical protein n=1 Tax=Micromonospora sp. NPDC050495 TaxID=3154936 RepID=UPI0033F0B336
MRWTTGALIGVAILTLASGCGADPATSPPGTAQPGATGAQTPVPIGPNVAEALEVANKQFTLLADGDWAGAYALWTDAAKKEISKKDFEKVNKACPFFKGDRIELQDVKPASMELVELTWHHAGRTGHSAIRQTGKTWRYDPGGETLAEYASGPDKAIAKRKADNACPAA